METSDRTGRSRLIAAFLRRVLLKALTRLRLRNIEISLTLISDAQMRRLNRKYRRIDRTTDVLSFGQNSEPPCGRRLLGDVLIAVSTARRQARQAQRDEREEFAMLAVHGLLHLLGHDHKCRKGERTMFALQERLLRSVTRP
ncbi:MAG: rRNA maturation RNase YbeY [Pseudomonadota bacterium]